MLCFDAYSTAEGFNKTGADTQTKSDAVVTRELAIIIEHLILVIDLDARAIVLHRDDKLVNTARRLADLVD